MDVKSKDGDNTPEGVALKLLEFIATAEGKALIGQPAGTTTRPDRKWILDCYAECHLAVAGKRPAPKAGT